MHKTPAGTDELKPSLVVHRLGCTPSFVDLGSRLAVDDRRCGGQELTCSTLPSSIKPKVVFSSPKEKTDIPISLRSDESPVVDSRTKLPHRETNLHKFAAGAIVEHQQGEEESERTYSATTLPPPPRQSRRDP